MIQSNVGRMRLIEPFGAGGGPDVVARAIARPLSERLGRRVDVVNHPGGGSTEAPALVLDAPADGDTLLINTSAHAYSAVAVRDLAYDPLKDLVAVAPLTTQAYVSSRAREPGSALLRSSLAQRSNGPGRFGSVRRVSAQAPTSVPRSSIARSGSMRPTCLPTRVMRSRMSLRRSSPARRTTRCRRSRPQRGRLRRATSWRSASRPRTARLHFPTSLPSPKLAPAATTSRFGTAPGLEQTLHPRSWTG